MSRDNYSTDPSPRTVEPRKCLVDASTLARVQRAMSGNCHECRGGKRKNMSGGMVKCELCNGTGRMQSYTISQIANYSATTVSKTIDSLRELEFRKQSSREVVGGCEYWSLIR